MTPWPAGTARRASINSFGYGGANAHVIIEAAPALPPSASREETDVVLVFSAHDDVTLKKNITALNKSIGSYNVHDIAYTLNRRSKLSNRGFTIRQSFDRKCGTIVLDESKFRFGKPRRRNEKESIAFIFNGETILPAQTLIGYYYPRVC